MLGMFRALLRPSSGAREYMCVITRYGVKCFITGCRGSGAGQQAVHPGRGMLHVAQHPSSGRTACCSAYHKCNKAYSDI